MIHINGRPICVLENGPYAFASSWNCSTLHMSLDASSQALPALGSPVTLVSRALHDSVPILLLLLADLVALGIVWLASTEHSSSEVNAH